MTSLYTVAIEGSNQAQALITGAYRRHGGEVVSYRQYTTTISRQRLVVENGFALAISMCYMENYVLSLTNCLINHIE